MKQSELELRLVSWKDPRFQAMSRALNQEYIDRFGDVAKGYQQHNTLQDIDLACILLSKGECIASGAFQEMSDTTVELKRVYVLPPFRRKGFARKLVDQLEFQAFFQGYLRMELMTGQQMPEAVALYTRMGYKKIPNFDSFAEDTVVVCMGKELL